MIKLYRNFKHWQESGCIWVYSDPHFNDESSKLINPNWLSPTEQIKNINNKVGKKDTIIFLGDIGDESFIKQIKGYKVLLLGNHDKGILNYKKQYFLKFNNEWHYYDTLQECLTAVDYIALDKDEEVSYRDTRMFDEVYDGPLFISNKILLSHEPINIPFGINIHGHCHECEQSIYYSNEWARVNVCADVINFIPLRLDKIIEKFKAKDIHRLTINRANSYKCPINNVNCSRGN